jgi:UPF0271 protein
MHKIDINADLGELNIEHDAQLLPFISSANIACGVHAGNPQYMSEIMQLCQQQGIAIGAHPSYWDHQHFGRRELNSTPEEVYQLIAYQLGAMQALATSQNIQLKHVKPHGALYNRSAIDQLVADAIAQAVFDCDATLILVGLANSQSLISAKAKGLQAVAEGFADRRYTEHGLLVPRTQANAMIENSDEAIAQVLAMIQHGKFSCESGQHIELCAQTICLHGDGPHALDFAKALHSSLQLNNIHISSEYA